MAEFLIKAIDATHSDSIKDQRGCYKRGDIVDLRPDGWTWGGLELLAPANGGKFVVLKVTDVTVEQVKQFAINKLGALAHWLMSETSGVDAEGAPIIVRRRRLRFDVDLVPAGVRNTLNKTGQYSTTWTAIKGYLRDKVSNTVF